MEAEATKVCDTANYYEDAKGSHNIDAKIFKEISNRTPTQARWDDDTNPVVCVLPLQSSGQSFEHRVFSRLDFS